MIPGPIKQRSTSSTLLLTIFLAPKSLCDSTAAKETIKIGLAHLPPIVIIQRDPKTNAILNVTGTYVNTYDWISKFSYLEYVFVPLSDADIDKKGIYVASREHIYENDELDIAATGHKAIPEPDYIEYSFPVNMLQYCFMTPLPDYESRDWAVIRPFQPMVWLFLAITAILVILSLSLLSLFRSKGRGIEMPLNLLERYAGNFTLLISNLTNQGNSIPVDSRDSFRVLAGAWFLVALVLVNSYAGVLIPSLTVNKIESVIDSMEDFLAGDKQPGLKLAESNIQVYKALRDELKKNPEGMLLTIKTGTTLWTLLASRKYAVFEAEPITNYQMGMDYKLNNGTCRYWQSRPVGVTLSTVLALRKYGKLNKIINRALQVMLELCKLCKLCMLEIGLMRFWLKQQQEKLPYDKCKAKNVLRPTTQPRTPIKLTDLTSAFIIFGLGISIAFLVFVVEQCISLFRSKNVVSVVHQ